MCRRLLVVLAVAGVVATAQGAAPPAPTLQGLRKEYQARLSRVRHPEDEKAVSAWYSEHLLAFARRHPRTDDAFTALTLCVAYRRSHIPKGCPAAEAVAILRKDHVEHKDMILKAPMLGRMADEGCSQLLRAVIERHPDRRTRAKACHALSNGRKGLARLGNTVTPFSQSFFLFGGRNHQIHHEYQYLFHGTHGKEYTDLLIANASKYWAESAEMARRMEKDFPGLFPDLSIGSVAPEVVSEGLDGKPVRLSDLRGKVVVLDIWATWCGPCVAMIPHQREMVKRLEGKPFALVSISVDDRKDTVARFLQKRPMPWAHWWNGPGRGLVIDWEVTHYPTIYVLDHKGIIRYRDLRDRQLEAAVTRLLREKEARPAP